MNEARDYMRELKQLRDELELKMHLASMEVKEEWDELEDQWEQFSTRAKLETSAESMSAAAKTLGNEIKESYRRIKRALKS